MKLHFVIKRKNKVKIWRTKDEQWKEGCMQVAAIDSDGRVNFGVQLHLKEPVVVESIMTTLIVTLIVAF